MPTIVNRIPLDKVIEVRTFSDGSIVLFDAATNNIVELDEKKVTMLKYITATPWLILGWHTSTCIEQSLCALAEISAWKRRWPKYCKLCDGAGQFWIDSSRDTPGYYDPCFCSEARTCPRCGTRLALKEDCSGPCIRCQWNYNDRLPEVPECTCGDRRRELVGARANA